MYYLNDDMKIVHRDLKAANVFLVEKDNKLEAKVGDFGHSLNKITNFKKNRFNLGTLGWMVIIKYFIIYDLLCTFK